MHSSSLTTDSQFYYRMEGVALRMRGMLLVLVLQFYYRMEGAVIYCVHMLIHSSDTAILL